MKSVWPVFLTISFSFCAALDHYVQASDFSCAVVRPSTISLAPDSGVSPIGTKKLIFYRVRFPDDQTDPVSLEEATETLKEVEAVFTRVSAGKFQLVTTVSPVLFLENSRDTYAGIANFDRFISDARAAGKAAGYDFGDYDLDIVRHSGVPDFMSGNANIGSRGAQVQAPGAPVIIHELGHNLGLNHANAWETGTPGLSNASPPLPSNYPGQPDPRTVPIYVDSFLGHESIIGPGFSAEYGDSYDIMGSGTVEFGAIYRAQLGWLNAQDVSIATNGLQTIRIQSTDGVLPDLPRAIRVMPAVNTPIGEREYWIQFAANEANRAVPPGVQIRWADPTDAPTGAQLLNPLAGHRGVAEPEILRSGRTFSDVPNGVHITLLNQQGEGATRFADVAIFVGTPLTNRAPEVQISAPKTEVLPNELIQLSGTAHDPDGDELVWRWDFGDGLATNIAGGVSRSWRATGDFLVSLEVSDLKGGIGRAIVPIRVGQPKSFRVSSRVLSDRGTPVVGARVHNGVNDAGASDKIHLYTFTDSDGVFVLTGVQPGLFDFGAFKFGYATDRRPALAIVDHDLVDVDFTAKEIAHIRVSAASVVAEGSGMTNLFVLTRSGSLEKSLTVNFALSGTATPGRDYVRPFINRVTFQPGAPTAFLALDLADDGTIESDETIRLSINYPTIEQRTDQSGNTYEVYLPGLELVPIAGQNTWVQTDPVYIPDAGAFKTVVLRDNNSAPYVEQALSATLDHGYLQLTLTAPISSHIVLQGTSDFQSWIPILTNAFTQESSAVFTISHSGTNAFFRTVRVSD